MELKYEIFENHNITSTLHKLGSHPRFAPKTALKIAKLVDGIRENEKTVIAEYRALIDAHAVKDDKGAFIPEEDHDGKPRPGTFKVKDQAAWMKAKSEFESKTFKLQADPIAMKDLEGVGLSPWEIKILEPMLTELSLA